jgi:hypothetical protein
MWVRDPNAIPQEIRVTIVIDRDKHPELARWVWGLPFRQASGTLRDILSAAARQTSSPGSSNQPPVAHRDHHPVSNKRETIHEPHQNPMPVEDGITKEAASVMKSFREMF